MIYIKVREDGSLETLDKTVSDSVRFETVKFKFPISWDGYVKTVVFKNQDIILSVLLDKDSGLYVGENEVYVPHEVLRFPEFKISVFGVLGNSRCTTVDISIKVIQSGYAQGGTPSDPTPSEYEQLVNLVNEAKQIAQSVKIYADNIFANAPKGTKSDAAILLDDVSPVTHEMGVKIRGKNLFDVDMSFTDDNKVTDGAATGYLTYFIQLQPNTKYYAKCFNPITTDITVTILSSNKAVNSDVNKAILLSKQLTGWKTELVLTTDDTGRLYVGNNANALNKIKEILSACNLQLELSTTPTDYTPYVPDLTAVKVSRYGKNLFDNNKLSDWGLTLSDGKYTGNVSLLNTKTLFSSFKSNTRYTISVKASNLSKSSATLLIIINYTDGTTQTVIRVNSTTEVVYSFTSTANKSISNITSTFYSGDTINIAYIQIEEGTIATDYEPYKGTEYTPNADGTVNGVTSLYPNTILMSDTDGVLIDCEYNRDINKAFAALEAAIATNNS